MIRNYPFWEHLLLFIIYITPNHIACAVFLLFSWSKKKKKRFHQNVELLASGQLVNFYPRERVPNLTIWYPSPEMVCSLTLCKHVHLSVISESEISWVAFLGVIIYLGYESRKQMMSLHRLKCMIRLKSDTFTDIESYYFDLILSNNNMNGDPRWVTPLTELWKKRVSN